MGVEKPEEYSPDQLAKFEKSRKESDWNLANVKGAGYKPGETRLRITDDQYEQAKSMMDKELSAEYVALKEDLDQIKAEISRLKEHANTITSRMNQLEKLGVS